MNVLTGLLVVLVSGALPAQAILSGGGDQLAKQQAETTAPTKTTESHPKLTDSFRVNGTAETNANSTFYYEADTFLLNKNEQQEKAQKKLEEQGKGAASAAEAPPASINSTSGRSGRMLDLDALVGDFAASQSVRARSQTGNRQSRGFLPAGQALELGKGKRLHIQGFIPIVGVKDVTNEHDESAGTDANGSTGDSSASQDQQQQPQFDLQQLMAATNKKIANHQQADHELPYAQSSIGHASFMSPQQAVVSSQSIDAKSFSGGASGVVDTLRKPLKKLMRYGETQQQQSLNNYQQRPQQSAGGCLCVPFYLCRSGFLSESSLGSSQVQQLIASQQLQQLSAQPKSSQQQLMLAPAPKALVDPNHRAPQSSQAQFATLSAQVDERSLDRDIITMAPLISRPTDDGGPINQTNDASQVSLAAHNFEGEAVNSTGSGGSGEQFSASDYSQEILGRMLGIKSSTKLSSSLAESSSVGVCGLLRTCCQIPAHLIASGQQIDYVPAGESSQAFPSNQMSFSGSSSHPSAVMSNRYPPASIIRQQANQHDMSPMSSQQQLQKYQQLSGGNALQRGGTPYGFPSMQISRMQPLNGPVDSHMSNLMSTALAHRSNMFQQPTAASSNRFQLMSSPSSQPGDFKRAPQQIHYVPYQQQQQAQHQATMMSLGDAANQLNGVRMAPQTGSAVINSGQGVHSALGSGEPLGTRKILEGRCGLRQSAGINGRVQNLQYQENSADFGEYPAQAAILKRLSGTDNMFVCGGTLISQFWIATAAHCIKKHSIGDLKVRLGEWDVHRDDEFYPYVEKGIRDLVVHSEFVAGNLVNDIALLRLDSPLDASLPHVNPACLPTLDENFTHQKCWVTGWGKDSFGQKGSFQTVLQEVELPIVSQTECESALRQTRLGPHYRLHPGFICAGGEGGKDACEGDGGSGLYCMQDGLIKVAGLVSWGIGCGQQGVPGVYVNLAHYRPWIENIISIDEDIYSRNSANISEIDTTATTTSSSGSN